MSTQTSWQPFPWHCFERINFFLVLDFYLVLYLLIVCECPRMYFLVCVYTCGGQRSMSVFLCCLPLYLLLEQRPNITISARLTGYVPGGLPTPDHITSNIDWGYRHVLMVLSFYLGHGIELGSLRLHNKHFIHWAISPDPSVPSSFILFFYYCPRMLNLEPCINCPGWTWTYSIVQAGSEHAALLFQPLRSWDCRPVPTGWAGKWSSYLFLMWGGQSQEISKGFYPTQHKAFLNTVFKQWTVGGQLGCSTKSSSCVPSRKEGSVFWPWGPGMFAFGWSGDPAVLDSRGAQ